MAIEDGLRALLLTKAAVTALSGTRIRPDELNEDDTFPAIVIDVREEEEQNSLDGLGGLVKADIVISCMAEKKSQARALAEAVRTNGTNPGTGLAGYSGVAGNELIDAAVLNKKVSGFVRYDDGADEGAYVCDCMFTIWYSETT